MKLTVVDLTNKKSGEVTVSDDLFRASVSPALLAQYLRVFRNNQRQAGARSLSRGEVTGTTAKVWRQKGTGRARHGSRKAPIFVGGGKAHGPDGTQNYKRTISKTMRRIALFGALFSKKDAFTVVSGLDKIEAKTKDFDQTLKTLVSYNGRTKVMLILDKPNPNVIKALANLPKVTATQASRLNAYEVIMADKIIVSKDSLSVMESTFLEVTK